MKLKMWLALDSTVDATKMTLTCRFQSGLINECLLNESLLPVDVILHF